jgi:GT2 family glycosyltransferase
MKLSVVILCWNDTKVLNDCLQSIYAGTHSTDFEVIVSDNGSTDGTPDFIRRNYPETRVVENHANLGFAKGNNAGIAVSQGEYVLILNPDTIVHDAALNKFLDVAEKHPEAGAFGCRVLNPDGSYQISARPFPTIWRYWVQALYLKPISYVSKLFICDTYSGWHGDTERTIDWQSGCCVMYRSSLLKRLGGFDGQFFYEKEEVDLCRRVWNAGYSVIFTPQATITHLGGQSVSRFPVRFELERYRSRYRYFYKHFGPTATRRCRTVTIVKLRLRQLGYGFAHFLKPSMTLKDRLEMYRVVMHWNSLLDPVRFVEAGEEPDIPMAT